MKKVVLNFGLAIIITFPILFMSCSKSDDFSSEIINPSSENQQVYKADPPLDLCTLVEITHPVGEPGEWDCVKPTENCLCDPVVIEPPGTKSTGSKFDIFQDFKESLANNQLGQFFSGNKWVEIFPMLNEPYAAEWLELLKTESVNLIEIYNPYKDKPKLFNNQQTNTSNWFKFLTLIARIKVRKTCMS